MISFGSCIHHKKNIQTEKVFCWCNDDFMYHIWVQSGYELITLVHCFNWANQNARNVITIVQLLIILIIMPLKRKVVLLIKSMLFTALALSSGTC